MDDNSAGTGIKHRVVGYLYAFLYFISDKLLMGASIMGWISVGAIVLGGLLWLRSGFFAWFAICLTLLLVLRITHRIAKRDGFIVFDALDEYIRPLDAEQVKNYQKFDLRASGIFSIAGREEYMFQRPIKLWRVPFGDHALMVQRPTGVYLYQFIEAGYIATIRPGWLVYGPQVISALEIDFKTTWGPEAGETEFKWFSRGEGSQPKRLKRTLYLGFDSEADRDAIWDSLLRGRLD
ncbi:MAG TPA: hypothetical protein VFI27_19905 [candidate division Zixibacteria bacterium]|nr:hypothetical protein [candidate division Zixibacteria bacterium]